MRRPGNDWQWGLCLLFVGVLAAAPAGSADDKKDEKKKPDHSAVKPEQRKQETAVRRHEAFLERAREGNVDVLFLGDSITQGWESNGKDAWKKLFDGLKVKAANFGIGGDRTQHVLWRIRDGQELKGIQPRVVVLMIGTNNLGSNNPQEVAEGVEAIVQELRQQLPESRVLLMGVLPRGAKEKDLLRSLVRQVNERLKKLADDKMVRYLDIGDEFLEKEGDKKDDKKGDISKDLMPDLVHLSPKGYQLWAKALEKPLQEMLTK
jgi:beta-glucosidase